MDINPSIELSVSREGMVLKAEPLNAAGEAILAQVQLNRVQLEDYVTAIMEEAIRQEYLTEMVLLTLATVQKEDTGAAAVGGELQAQAQAAAEAVLAKHQLEHSVSAFPVSGELRQAAKAAGVSAGQYAVYLEAQEEGLELPLADLKEKSITRAIEDVGGSSREVVQKAGLKAQGQARVKGKAEADRAEEKDQSKDKDKSKDKDQPGAEHEATTEKNGKEDKDKKENQGKQDNGGKKDSRDGEREAEHENDQARRDDDRAKTKEARGVNQVLLTRGQVSQAEEGPDGADQAEKTKARQPADREDGRSDRKENRKEDRKEDRETRQLDRTTRGKRK